MLRALLASIIALTLASEAGATSPPAPWVGKDIGAPGAAGSAAVDASGVWTVRGSGLDILGPEDQFFFVYQPVKGDGSIIARLLSQQDASPKTGVMIRADESPGAANAALLMTTAILAWQRRDTAGDETIRQGADAPRQLPTLMRVQRAGSDLTGFVSDDGLVWRQVTPTRRISMAESVLFGLAVTSRRDGQLTTATFDRVAVQPGLVSPTGAVGCGGDRSVLLSWTPLPAALGYNVYRVGPGTAGSQLARLNTRPVPMSFFVDAGPGLTNGTGARYAITPLLKTAGGSAIEGAAVEVAATLVAAPPGFAGCSINEGPNSGSVLFDPRQGEITLRGSGDDRPGAASDQFYFLAQAVEGDAQVTVRMLTRPGSTNDRAAAGLVIRDSLSPGARNVAIGIRAAFGLGSQWRYTPDGPTSDPLVLDNDSLTLPITLRITRRADTITPEYSTDDGQTFHPAGEPVTFRPPLPQTLYAGLGITAGVRGQVSEARFGVPKIRKL